MLFALKSTLFLTCLILFLEGAFAQKHDLSWVQEVLEKSQKDGKLRQEVLDLVEGVGQKTTNLENKNVCPTNTQDLQEANMEDRYPHLLVFVSFSIPMESLKVLGEQVSKAGGKIVFRGLVNGSFKQTAQKLKELGIEALIDPTLFERFRVKACPVFVLTDKPLQNLETKFTYDQLTGHVSLAYVLETFSAGGNQQADLLHKELLKGGSR